MCIFLKVCLLQAFLLLTDTLIKELNRIIVVAVSVPPILSQGSSRLGLTTELL